MRRTSSGCSSRSMRSPRTPRAPSTPNTPLEVRVSIDHRYYPHIMEAILRHASCGALMALRSASREWHERATTQLMRHVVVVQGDGGVNVASLRTPAGVRLPRRLLGLRSCRDAIRVLDFDASLGAADRLPKLLFSAAVHTLRDCAGVTRRVRHIPACDTWVGDVLPTPAELVTPWNVSYPRKIVCRLWHTAQKITSYAREARNTQNRIPVLYARAPRVHHPDIDEVVLLVPDVRARVWSDRAVTRAFLSHVISAALSLSHHPHTALTLVGVHEILGRAAHFIDGDNAHHVYLTLSLLGVAHWQNPGLGGDSTRGDLRLLTVQQYRAQVGEDQFALEAGRPLLR